MSADNQTQQTNASADSAATGGSEPKWFLTSKTIIGAIVGIAPQILGLLGFHFADGEIQSVATAITSLLSAILVVWGRITAERPLSFKPQTPGQSVVSAVMVGAALSLGLQGCAESPVLAKLKSIAADTQITGSACYEVSPGVKVCATGTQGQSLDVVARVKKDGADGKVIIPLIKEGSK